MVCEWKDASGEELKEILKLDEHDNRVNIGLFRIGHSDETAQAWSTRPIVNLRNV